MSHKKTPSTLSVCSPEIALLLKPLNLQKYISNSPSWLKLKGHKKYYNTLEYVPHECVVEEVPTYTVDDLLRLLPVSINFKDAYISHHLQITILNTFISAAYNCIEEYYGNYSVCEGCSPTTQVPCMITGIGDTISDALSKLCLHLFERRDTIVTDEIPWLQ